jgi:hypothetical protein
MINSFHYGFRFVLLPYTTWNEIFYTEAGRATLSRIATSGELAMEVWQHSQHFCNF